MNNLDNILNEALEMLKKGHSQQEVLIKFAQNKTELAPLLELSQALLSVPKNIVPTPLMQRKYAAIPVKHFWLAWFHISKFAGISVSLALLLSIFGLTGYAASNSTPGNALFSIKKSAEKVEVLLAYNKNQKASLQVAIANQRLTDAQNIFNDPQSNDAQKTAALNELADQTRTAVATVKTAASSDPQPGQTSPLINSLASITSQQQTLLTAIKPDSQTQSATQSAIVALTQSTSQLTQIKQSVSVADTNQTLTALNSNPDSVSVLGQINKIDGGKITVEQTVFTLTATTSIADAEGNSLTSSQLSLNEKINIVGTKEQNSLMAEQILVTDASSTATSTPEVKSASTQATSSVSSTVAASSTVAQTQGLDKKPDATSTTGSAATTTPTDPNTATGSYIYESPAPQFVQ